MSNLDEYKRLNTRQCSVLHVGGFRPSGDPLASNFGLRPLGAPDETWPVFDDKPLLFVCQLNLTTAPVVPEVLRDLALITFFVVPDPTELSKENGENWFLRTYSALNGLVPLAPPKGAPALKRGFECRWEELEDHPNYDDPDVVVPDGFDNSEVQLENLAHTKIGGYATSIQSEPWWGYEDHSSGPAYALQIMGEEKVGLASGDGGCVYLARGTAAGAENEWFLDWQFF